MSVTRKVTPDIVSSYVDAIISGDKGDQDPSRTRDLIREVSSVLDHSAEKVVRTWQALVETSPEHHMRIDFLKNLEDGKAQGSKGSPVAFREDHPFEYFVALNACMTEKKPKGITLRLPSTSEDQIGFPAYINPSRVSDPTMMHVLLGAGTSAPRYEGWSESDPSIDPKKKSYIDPLYHLENVRQPEFCAASVLKQQAYACGLIGHEERYGQEYACVELKDQMQEGVQKQKRVKSGQVLHLLVDHACEGFSAPDIEEKKINQKTDFSSLFGQQTYLDLSVEPSSVLEAAEQAFINDDKKLTDLMTKLFIGSMNGTKINAPTLASHLLRKGYHLSA